jgi:hypothetical protein
MYVKRAVFLLRTKCVPRSYLGTTKIPSEGLFRKWAHLVRGILYIYPENVWNTQCRAMQNVYAAFTSPFDRIVTFSYQIPYISSLFKLQRNSVTH